MRFQYSVEFSPSFSANFATLAGLHRVSSYDRSFSPAAAAVQPLHGSLSSQKSTGGQSLSNPDSPRRSVAVVFYSPSMSKDALRLEKKRQMFTEKAGFPIGRLLFPVSSNYVFCPISFFVLLLNIKHFKRLLGEFFNVFLPDAWSSQLCTKDTYFMIPCRSRKDAAPSFIIFMHLFI